MKRLLRSPSFLKWYAIFWLVVCVLGEIFVIWLLLDAWRHPDPEDFGRPLAAAYITIFSVVMAAAAWLLLYNRHYQTRRGAVIVLAAMPMTLSIPFWYVSIPAVAWGVLAYRSVQLRARRKRR